MIATLNGKIKEVETNSIILDVNNIGYRISATKNTLLNMRTDQEVFLYTHFAVRENSQVLYGFTEKEELQFFELLLTISGIGPKSALGILDSAPIETIKEGVASGDASHLTKVSGIGKKSAEKIIIELRDKLGSFPSHDGVNFEGGGVAIEALTSLGYGEREAREAIQKVDRSLSAESMIKEALKNLSN